MLKAEGNWREGREIEGMGEGREVEGVGYRGGERS